jgi:N-acetylmuramic acid 6-phosphate etherase
MMGDNMATSRDADDLPPTERRNPRAAGLSGLSALQIVRLMNQEDAGVVPVVGRQCEQIARAAEMMTAAIRSGGRVFYVGAGTSGRLGVLDAAECPPTFGVAPDLVQGVIAGGEAALTRAQEGAEDDAAQGGDDLRRGGLAAGDVVVGISAGGRTPYVLGALEFAESIGARRVGVTCNPTGGIAERVEILIAPEVGPEVIAGSTRLKAGTATKLVLNMLTTTTFILLGRTADDLMQSLRPASAKLADRAVRIVMAQTGAPRHAAQGALEQAGGDVAAAVRALGRSDEQDR